MEWQYYARQTRERLGLCRSQMAQMLGASPDTIRYWELGRGQPQAWHREIYRVLHEHILDLEKAADRENISVREMLLGIISRSGLVQGIYRILDLIFSDGKN